MKQYLKLIPGFLLALVIAAAAKWLEGLLPIHLIGASVIALFIGMIINHSGGGCCHRRGIHDRSGLTGEAT